MLAFLLITPFILQACAMLVDEFYFHHRRGLPLWEKVGHPFDSMTVFLSYFYLTQFPPTDEHLYVYIGLCSFSCLFITKDEFIHSLKCEASENWLHSILFILHPITFLSAGVIWWQNLYPSFLIVQPVIILVFMGYQITYWSMFGKSK